MTTTALTEVFEGAQGFRHHEDGLVQAFQAKAGPDVSGHDFTNETTAELAASVDFSPTGMS